VDIQYHYARWLGHKLSETHRHLLLSHTNDKLTGHSDAGFRRQKKIRKSVNNHGYRATGLSYSVVPILYQLAVVDQQRDTNWNNNY